MKSERQWDIKVSHYALNTINPIRQVLENLNASPNPNKKLIPLSIGKFLILYKDYPKISYIDNI